MKRNSPKPIFDLGFSTKKEDLTIRLLNRQRRRLEEIAAALSEPAGRTISTSRLVQAAIKHHIDCDGQIAPSDQREIARASTAGTKREFDLSLSDIGTPLQILLHPAELEAFDQVARRQNKERSETVREAVDFLIHVYDREGPHAFL
jgi:hypothetical protein